MNEQSIRLISGNDSNEDEQVAPMTLREVISLTAVERPTLENIRVGDILVDSYQRQLSQPHVDRIAKNFNWQLFFAVGLSHRKDGSYFCFEGQHRVAAALKVFGENEQVPAICVEGLSREDEAYLFYAMQTTRRNLSPYDRFRAQLDRGEPGAIQMDEIVRSHGYELKPHNGSHTLPAVAQIENLFYPQSKRVSDFQAINRDITKTTQQWIGPARLDWVLSIVVQAWDYRCWIPASILKALGAFYTIKMAAKPPLDEARLIRTLRTLDSDGWGRRAQERRSEVFPVMVADYNFKLSSGRKIVLT